MFSTKWNEIIEETETYKTGIPIVEIIEENKKNGNSSNIHFLLLI